MRKDPLDVGAELNQAAVNQDGLLGVDVLRWDLQVGDGEHPTLFVRDGASSEHSKRPISNRDSLLQVGGNGGKRNSLRARTDGGEGDLLNGLVIF